MIFFSIPSQIGGIVSSLPPSYRQLTSSPALFLKQTLANLTTTVGYLNGDARLFDAVILLGQSLGRFVVAGGKEGTNNWEQLMPFVRGLDIGGAPRGLTGPLAFAPGTNVRFLSYSATVTHMHRSAPTRPALTTLLYVCMRERLREREGEREREHLIHWTPFMETLSLTHTHTYTLSHTHTQDRSPSPPFDIVNLKLGTDAGGAPTHVISIVGQAASMGTDIRVCPVERGVQTIGEHCHLHAETPEIVSCRASASGENLMLQWRQSTAGNGRVKQFLVSSEGLWANDGLAVKALDSGEGFLELPLVVSTSLNAVYSIVRGSVMYFTVRADYADADTTAPILSKPTGKEACRVCFPEDNVSGTCGCSLNNYHNSGQPGVEPPKWACQDCPDGLVCAGGTFRMAVSAPGWFITGNGSATSSSATASSTTGDVAAVAPQLYECANRRACPGGVNALEVMMAGEAVLQQQCAKGYAGMQCGACAQGSVSGWGVEVPGRTHGNSTGCEECPSSPATTLGVLFGTIAGVCVIAAIAVMIVRRAARPLPIERALRIYFRNVQRRQGIEGVARRFVADFIHTGSVSPSHRCSVGTGAVESALRRIGIVTETTAPGDIALFLKHIDVDGDGQVSWEEFFIFVQGRERENTPRHQSMSRGPHCAAQLLYKAWGWFQAYETVAVLTVTVSYLQLFASVDNSFPDMARLAANAKATATAATPTPTTSHIGAPPYATNGTANGMIDFNAGLEQVAGFLSAFDVTTVVPVLCLIGPRYVSRLIFHTVLPYALVTLAWLPYLLFRCYTRHKTTANKGGPSSATERRRRSAGLTTLKRSAIAFSSYVVFFYYPLAARTVLRAFVCDKRIVDGKTTMWLADDFVVRCDGAAYTSLVGYAIAAVLAVVVAMPLSMMMLLLSWRFPFNRLHELTDEGRWRPAQESDLELGSLFRLFRPAWWGMGLLELLRKLLFTSLIGVLFKDWQSAVRSLTAYSYYACMCVVVIT